LYLGASPVWTLLWEERPQRTWASARRYGAALLALAGVLVLFWPALQTAKLDLLGEFLGLAASILWATFSHQMRILSASLSGAEVAAHTMWMSGIGLMPFGLAEIYFARGIPINAGCLGVLAFCIVFGGVIAYALWNDALRRWRTSQVMLFNNLIPLSTMAWAWFFLQEPVTPTFWAAMVLIVIGVVLGQANWTKILACRRGFDQIQLGIRRWGARPTLAWLDAPSRPASGARWLVVMICKISRAVVFREGVENCARGGRAPFSISEFGFKNALPFQTPRSLAGPDRRWSGRWEFFDWA
jgi:hypothetical protein